jgi:hypothetical protein
MDQNYLRVVVRAAVVGDHVLRLAPEPLYEQAKAHPLVAS